MTRRRFERVSFLLGSFLFCYLLWQLGWRTLAHDFRSVGWFLFLILAASGIRYVVRAVSWAAAFFPEERQSWRDLFGYRLAGEALNYLSIAGPLLGEPVKASMLRGIRFAPSLGSTLLETTVNGVAAVLVTLLGIALLLLRHTPAAALRHAGYLAMAVLLLFVVGVPYALKRRLPVLTWPWKRLRRAPWLSSPVLGENLAIVEARMHRLSAERPGALWLIFLLGFVTQGLAILEIYAVMLPLGIAPAFSTVVIVEAVTKLVKAIFFFVPARIGADEGSTAGIFTLLGFAPAAGMTLALARRLRAIFWSGIGLAFLLSESVKPALEQSESKPQQKAHVLSAGIARG